ncbi:unnamed protein product [Cuscuta campestris]|uniref:Uncharacterized protein n=1 Tax=Cuscuta campestris TaxID=132261 RepID=A0A484MTF1_9ASTE|nr:unnamed protein product [Cuscuta campestris]
MKLKKEEEGYKVRGELETEKKRAEERRSAASIGGILEQQPGVHLLPPISEKACVDDKECVLEVKIVPR